MRDMFDPSLIIAIAAIASLAILSFAALRGWNGWLALKARELDLTTGRPSPSALAPDTTLGAARIEISDLKERIRKLEAIASGVDL